MEEREQLKFAFISHSNEEPDRSLLLRLDEYLLSQQLCAWYDIKGLRANSWMGQLGDKIKEATAYVLIASERSLRSEEVKSELEKIRDEHVYRKKMYIPFVLDDSYFHLRDIDSKLYYMFGGNTEQAVILSKFPSEQAAFERLADYLRDVLEVFTNNPKDFIIDEKGKLTKYVGSDSHVRIPASVTEIGEFAFSGRKQLQRVVIPPSVIKMERYAFGSCENLVAVDGMQGVQLCDVTAFKGTGILCDKSNGYRIGDIVFGGQSSGGELVIPEGTRTIACNAFTCNDAERIVLPEGLEHIGTMAFQDCPNIKEIEFPKSLKTIGKKAFAGCMDLHTAIFSGEAPTDVELAFDKIDMKELKK